MVHIDASIEFLIRGESLDGFTPDLAYRPNPDFNWPANTLLVDYELPRLRRCKSSTIKCAELEDIAGPFQRILFYVTQFDSLIQVYRDLHAASRILSPAGQLRVLVRPRGRPKKVDAALKGLFGSIRRASMAETSLLVCTRPAPKPFESAESQVTYLEISTSTVLRFITRSGMFSCTRIDPGTELLLTLLPDLNGRHVLDVGCGYGIIGMVAAARGALVKMMDADARAIKLSRHNIVLNQLSAETILSDQIQDQDHSFDFVLANPPTHAGSDVLQRLFADMLRVCRSTGSALIVVREHLNYEKWLKTMGNVSRLGVKNGYKVLQISENV